MFELSSFFLGGRKIQLSSSSDIQVIITFLVTFYLWNYNSTSLTIKPFLLFFIYFILFFIFWGKRQCTIYLKPRCDKTSGLGQSSRQVKRVVGQNRSFSNRSIGLRVRSDWLVFFKQVYLFIYFLLQKQINDNLFRENE